MPAFLKRALILLCVLPLTVSARNDEETTAHFIIEKSAASRSENAISLNLISGTLSADALELHLCYRNTGAVTAPSFGVLTLQDYQLVETGSLTSSDAKTISPAINLVSPLDGIPPQLANAGSVVFPRPATREDLELRIAGFDPIRFSLLASRRFTPLAPAESADVSPGITLHSQHEQLSVFPFTISRVRVDDEVITVDLSFTNDSNRDLFVKSAGISGKDAYLVDARFEMHRAVRISDGLRDSIGPTETRWGAGQSNPGSLVFRRLHPHALRHLLISFPSYESLLLTFDEESRSYKSEIKFTGNRVNSGPHPLQVSAQLHGELSAFAQELTKSLQGGDRAGYLEHFAENSTARAHQVSFLDGLARVPIQDPRFRLVPGQPLKMGTAGEVKSASVFLEYAMRGIPGDNLFRSMLECDLIRDPDGGPWRIHRWLFTKQPPFWLLNFTGLATSDHFVIYYRPDSVSEIQLDKSRRQLDDAYRKLAKNEYLELDEKFAAFLIDREVDFAALTELDPFRYHGVASASYATDGNRFTALNRAMYINDFKLRLPSNSRGDSAREDTIVHELVHLALAADTRHFTPPWLIEGVAVHLAGQLTPETRRALLDSGRLPALSLSALSRGRLPAEHLSAREALNFEYLYAGEAVAFLIRTYGEKRFYDFYRSFAAISPAEFDQLFLEQKSGNNATKEASVPKIMHQITAGMIQRHFGVSLYDLNTIVSSNIAIKAM